MDGEGSIECHRSIFRRGSTQVDTGHKENTPHHLGQVLEEGAIASITAVTMLEIEGSR